MDSSTPRSHWPAELQRDFEANTMNGCVGSVLASETERVRVWHLHIPVGQRCAFHRHVLTYFWTAHAAGVARGYFEDGRVLETTHYQGETRHFSYGKGEYMVHAVENVGDTELVFTTVEFLDGANAPLPVPDSVRMRRLAGYEPRAAAMAAVA